MTIADGLIAELEQEAQATRRVLERIPEEHLAWRPHPKSMSLGQLALHVATLPGGVAELAAIVSWPCSGMPRCFASATMAVRRSRSTSVSSGSPTISLTTKPAS